jgi:hypothetical protein
MKLNQINNIAENCRVFMEHVIGLNEPLCYDALMERIRLYCADYTEHNDDTIDIDYMNMCFTVYMNKDGDWELCENASYYIINTTGCVEDTIDIELN